MRMTFEPYEPFPRCEAKRGYSRSHVKCEGPEGHPNVHMGRGRVGQWFVWGEKPKFIELDKRSKS